MPFKPNRKVLNMLSAYQHPKTKPQGTRGSKHTYAHKGVFGNKVFSKI
jgi:hypothetical protein